MFELKGYPDGSNITIMNCFYQYPKKKDDGHWSKDNLLIIFKDNDNGKKYFKYIEEPEYTYYLLKPQYQVNYNMAFIERDKVDPITCKYNSITKSIAEVTGNLDLYKDNIKTGNYKMNQLFFAHRRVFAADMNILNYTRSVFAERYKNPVCPITIAFFDIETDMTYSIHDEPEIGECPVNAISIYYNKTNTVYDFLLRNNKNPLIKKLETKMNKNFDGYKQKMRDYILKDLGSIDKVKKYRLENVELSVGYFNTELEMILAFFDLLHKLDPDFAVAYNIAFDLPTLLKRLEVNGVDPKDIVCDIDIPIKFCEYIIDKKNEMKFEERCDYANISSRITYIDQMITYASRRKGQSAVASYSLDYIGSLECGVNKYNYHDISDTLDRLPYIDFEAFWLYNIIDTIVQACIEAQTEDLKYMFNNVIEMNTPYQKIFRQTNYLGTKGVDFYKHHEGFIMGENVNRFGSKPEEKFPGAFVARPEKLSDRNKVKIKETPISKFNNANDFDYKRLYPSLMQEFNMASNTQVGLIQIDDPPYKDPSYLRLTNGSSFVENLTSYNFIEFCHRWMNMANVEEILEDIDEWKENNNKQSIVSVIDTHRAVYIKRPMPKWVKDEVDKIRKGIEL